MKKGSAPPIGLMPMRIWLETRDKERIKEIKAAIRRYLDYDKNIPDEWVEEYKYLIKEDKARE